MQYSNRNDMHDFTMRTLIRDSSIVHHSRNFAACIYAMSGFGLTTSWPIAIGQLHDFLYKGWSICL